MKLALILTTLIALGHPSLNSGPKLGASVTAFEPYHVTGPDAGTYTCPVCKYGLLPSIQLWVNKASVEKVTGLAMKLEQAAIVHQDQKLKAFVIFLKPKGISDGAEKKHLSILAQKIGLRHVAFLFTEANNEFVQPYHLNPTAQTTLLVTKRRVIVAKMVNPATTDPKLEKALSKATNSNG